jgi:predicted GH43/DUF377 family glycosyl hydrolase
MQHRLNTLLKLEEKIEQAKRKLDQHQDIVKFRFYKRSVSNKDFEFGDIVLRWEKSNENEGKHTKFQYLWLGPYQVDEKIGSGTFKIKTVEGEVEELPASDQILKNYSS